MLKHLPQAGTWTHVPGLDPIQNPAWDLKPQSWDSSQTKTQFGTLIHVAGTWTQPRPTVFQVSSQTWFQDVMNLRFLMYHCRKNSVRDKVIGKKWIYSDTDRSTLQRQSVGLGRGRMQQHNWVRLVSIGWLISHANEWEDYSNYFWEGVEISRIWASAHSLLF